MNDQELQVYKKSVKEKLDALLPIFAKACIGEYPTNLDIPEEGDEFRELYTGISLLTSLIRDQMADLKQINQSLELSVKEKTHELEHQLNLSRSLLEAEGEMGKGLILMDGTTGKIVFINNALCQLTGYSPLDLPDVMSILSLVHPDETSRVRERIRKLIAGQFEKDKFETLIVHRNGSQVFVEISVMRIKVEGSLRYFAVIRDATERKKNEEERISLFKEQMMRRQAEASKDRALFLFEATAMLFASLENKSIPEILSSYATIKTADWCCVAIGDDKGQIGEIAVSSSDPMKQSVAEALALIKPSQDWNEHPIMKVLKTGKSVFDPVMKPDVLETYSTDPRYTGILRQLGMESYICVPIQMGGKIWGALWLVSSQSNKRFTHEDLDMCEELALRTCLALNNMDLYKKSKDAEIFAKESEARFRQMADSAPVLIWVSELDMKCSFFNKAWLDFTGRTMEQELGDGWAAGVHPDDLDNCLWIYTSSFKNRNTFKMEYRLKRADGQYRWILDHGVPRFSPDGTFVGYIGSCIDITDRKNNEYKVARARDAALESARLKSEFVANVSHEIRTPMNAMIGMTGLLLKTGLNSNQREFLETINNSCQSLLTIINDLLDFSKMEADKMKLDLHSFNLRNMVEGTMALLAPRAHAKGLELISYFDPEIPEFVKADAGRIRQILINLANNAVKFTQEGEVVIRVAKENETDTHVALHFSVSDTGIGIQPHHREKLFKPFSQGDTSLTRRYGGTGIGLALSKRFVEMMEGEIDYESSPLQGSIFWFRLNLEKQPAQTPAEIPPKPNTVRVLVVDSNPARRKSVIQLLDSLKFCASEGIGSGVEATALLKQNSKKRPFDWVLLNRSVAQEDGLLIAKKIKTISRGSRILMMTRCTDSMKEKELQSVGVESWLIKPLRSAPLAAKLTSPTSTRKTRKTKDTSSKKSTKDLKILVAEDNSINQQVINLQLRELGIRADIVSNGFEALQALGNRDYDIVLMDCQMPEMDGYTATREIRLKENSGHHVPIIALTAHAMSGDREKCMAAGMDDYLPKPVTTEALAEMLTMWNKNHAPAASPKKRSAPLMFGVLNPPKALNNPGTIRRIAKIFLEKIDEHIQKMETALLKRDFNAIKIEAHTFKGSSASLGVMNLSGLCLKLQELAEKEDLEGVKTNISKLEEECQRVKQTLSLHLRRNGHENTARRR